MPSFKKTRNKVNYKNLWRIEEKQKPEYTVFHFDIATVNLLIHFLSLYIFQYIFKIAVKCVYTHIKSIYVDYHFLKVNIIHIFMFFVFFIIFIFNSCIRFHSVNNCMGCTNIFLYWILSNLLVILGTGFPYTLYQIIVKIRKAHVMWINYWI